MLRKFAIYSTALIIFGLLTQCEEYFKANSDDILIDEDYIGDVNEFYAGFMGVALKLQDAADQAVILEGLRGDLFEPTANAPQDLWDIYNFNEQQDNAYTNPRPFYDIIINANNFINKAHAYDKKNPGAVDKVLFEGLVGGALRFKIWAYLSLGKIYNEVLFFDDNLVEFRDISKFEKLRLTDGSLVSRLMSQMLSGMPLEDGGKSVNGYRNIEWEDLLYTGVSASGQDITWTMICPLPGAINIELELWAGNYENVVNLATAFLIAEAGDKGQRLMITKEESNGDWRKIFANSPVSNTRDLISIVPYDYNNLQTNSLINHFSNLHPAEFKLRPTQLTIDRFLGQETSSPDVYNDRYRGEGRTYREENGEWVFYKYTLGHDTEIYKDDHYIPLYRASDIHLWMVEGLTMQNSYKEAEALMNRGITAYSTGGVVPPNFPFDNGINLAAFSGNWGIRGRVSLASVEPTTYTKEEIYLETDDAIKEQKQLVYRQELDSLIIEETALECAGEARALYTMIRMALKYNDNSIVANRVSAKYPDGQKEAIKSRLLADPNNWFINFDLTDLSAD